MTEREEGYLETLRDLRAFCQSAMRDSGANPSVMREHLMVVSCLRI